MVMPNTQSAKKSFRQSQRRHVRNVKKITQARNAVKDLRKLIAAGKSAEAKALLPRVYQKLDKAVKTGVIKKNTASRKKSRLTKLLVAKE
ncbi:MAG: small subunit ribosomal protein S20 [Parcubacteria group bacterium Gr01-1014_29]|nr:MAG: small subunit ribosomal protein S20 [Parcubacteria group bacterium Gr01-1014_29]